jgi:hypothetical protein
LCAFLLNRANGFPATDYPGSFPLPNIGVAARSKAFASFGTGTLEKIPRIDARLDSWFYFLLLELGSEDSAADFRTTGMGPYDSQRMMRGRSRGRRLRGKIYKPSARYQTLKQTAVHEASQLQVLDGFLVKERSISREDSLNRT